MSSPPSQWGAKLREALANHIWNNEKQERELTSQSDVLLLPHLLTGTVGAVTEAVTRNPDQDVSAKSHKQSVRPSCLRCHGICLGPGGSVGAVSGLQLTENLCPPCREATHCKRGRVRVLWKQPPAPLRGVH